MYCNSLKRYVTILFIVVACSACHASWVFQGAIQGDTDPYLADSDPGGEWAYACWGDGTASVDPCNISLEGELEGWTSVGYYRVGPASEDIQKGFWARVYTGGRWEWDDSNSTSSSLDVEVTGSYTSTIGCYGLAADWSTGATVYATSAALVTLPKRHQNSSTTSLVNGSVYNDTTGSVYYDEGDADIDDSSSSVGTGSYSIEQDLIIDISEDYSAATGLESFEPIVYIYGASSGRGAIDAGQNEGGAVDADSWFEITGSMDMVLDGDIIDGS